MADPEVLGDELMRTITAMRRLVRRRLRPAMPGPRLRGAQVELLRAVEAEPGIGVAAAARALHLAPNSVSTLVNQLVDAGMLTRDTDPDDRRVARLRLTGAAAERLGAWRQARVELVGKGIAQLATGDIAALKRALPALRSLMSILDPVSDTVSDTEEQA
jgi:DNA-binding MarR family transcriptional regulator